MLQLLGLFGVVYAVLLETRRSYYDLFVQLIMSRANRRAAGHFECGPDRQIGLLHFSWLLPGVAVMALPGITKYSKLITLPGGVQYTSSPVIPFGAHHAAIPGPVRFVSIPFFYKRGADSMICSYSRLRREKPVR